MPNLSDLPDDFPAILAEAGERMTPYVDACLRKPLLRRYASLLKSLPMEDIDRLRFPNLPQYATALMFLLPPLRFPVAGTLASLEDYALVVATATANLMIGCACEYWWRVGYLSYQIDPTPYVLTPTVWLATRQAGCIALETGTSQQDRDFVAFMAHSHGKPPATEGVDGLDDGRPPEVGPLWLPDTGRMVD